MFFYHSVTYYKEYNMATIEAANVGKAVAARVGSNIREVRTRLGLTQAQLAAPEFSISYISAIGLSVRS
jgi:HTH-type transcriptional regulator, quorum sensing regulator NprR